MINKENYNDLYAFLLVAREGSFTKAAGKLGVSQSALSHSIRGLEVRLGILLLNRTTRSVSATEAGERLKQTISASFDLIDNELNLIHTFRDTPAGTVKINASGHAIRHILIPKLQHIAHQYPDVNVELSANNGMVDIVAERFDAGVRFGSRVADGMIAVRISDDVKMVVVASPQYFKEYATPQSPQELKQHVCLGYRLSTQGGLYQWEFQHNDVDFKIKIEERWVFNETELIVDAVRLGMGIAYIPEDLIRNDLAQGQLIQILAEYSIQYSGFHLYYPHRSQLSPALKLVIDILRV